ncbi:PREDICTED: uncharacterized protein LOC107191880 [Dufourea novaeangliae]|nr:PREDICTED: uncharacterized protein LOC107191880 [Dufourea novaeangliae]
MGNDEQNCETCTVPIESYLEIEYSADESDNIESVTKDCAMSTGSIKSLERANNSCNESTAPAGKRCVLNEFGVFRREDFIDEITWNRFLRACNGLRREKLLLKRKNERLLKKIKTFSDIIEELQKKNLLTDSLAEILKVNYRT